MKNKKLVITLVISVIILAALIFSIISCMDLHQKRRIEAGYQDEINSPNHFAKDVTMIELIANPEKYDGMLVRVHGVGNIGFEGNYIALNKEEYRQYMGNQIWLELGERAISSEEAQAYNGKYVIVEGIFDKDNSGHLGLFQGAIVDINRYDLVEIERGTE